MTPAKANAVVPPPDVAPFYEQDLSALWCAEERKPFTLTRFRRAITGMASIFFSTADNYFPENQAQLACTVYNADKPEASGLLVGAAYGDIPGTADAGTPRIMVHLGDLKYEKVALGDRNSLSSNLAEASLTKRLNGQLMISAESRDQEVPTMLLEPFRDFLEGTKHIWMSGVQVQEFEVTALQDMELLDDKPEVRYKSTLTCMFSGRLTVVRSQVSLPLKRIVLKAIPLGV
jgi:hypothetical protein